MADQQMLDVNTALLATAAADIRAQKPAIPRTQSTLSSTSLPPDAFGRIPESNGAAEQHSQHVKTAQTALDQAGQDLDRLAARLDSRKLQYDRAVRAAVDRLRATGSTRTPPMSFPEPPMTPWPRPDTPPMSPRFPRPAQ